jgi:hypothetical protein
MRSGSGSRICCPANPATGVARGRQPIVCERSFVGAAVRGVVPERYGKWKTVHKRFTRWAKAGVWERVFDSLTADPDNQYRCSIPRRVVPVACEYASDASSGRPPSAKTTDLRGIMMR